MGVFYHDVDVDLAKLLLEAFEDFQCNFKLPGILPGGSHCMMNTMSIRYLITI